MGVGPDRTLPRSAADQSGRAHQTNAQQCRAKEGMPDQLVQIQILLGHQRPH